MTKPTTQFNSALDLVPYTRSSRDAHGFVSQGDGFYKVVNPLYVFKKAYTKAGYSVLINLIIPTGAIIYGHISKLPQPYGKLSLQNCGKMRATRAKVHSIIRLQDNITTVYRNFKGNDSYMSGASRLLTEKEIRTAYSGHDDYFKYEVGCTVRPKEPFDYFQGECASGIHFFLNAEQALDY